jgi:hypothetical protein
MKNYSTEKYSTRTVTPDCESVTTYQSEPILVRIIHRHISPERADGLIGEKVTYSEKYLRLIKHDPTVPVPACGYFTITKAVLKDDGRVMVALHPVPSYIHRRNDGTDICVGWMKKVKMQSVAEPVEEDPTPAWKKTNPIFSRKISDCGFSARVVNGLRYNNINTAGDLAEASKSSDLLRMRNFGRKCLAEVEEFMKSNDLSFGMNNKNAI